MVNYSANTLIRNDRKKNTNLKQKNLLIKQVTALNSFTFGNCLQSNFSQAVFRK